MRLFDHPISGNCYKVRLLLAQLGQPFERVEVDVTTWEGRDELRAFNPAGRVPVLVLDDGRAIAESNAILWYLAEGTSYLHVDAYARAQVLQWLFFEQNLLEPNIGVARYLVSVAREAGGNVALLERLRQRGREALATLQNHLETRSFLVADRYSIADISLFAYTHNADEAGLDLGRHPAVQAWVERVRQQPGFVPMPRVATPA